MTNFERYKKDLRIIDVVEDIARYKCLVEPHCCPVEDLCNELADCTKLLRVYFEQEVEE